MKHKFLILFLFISVPLLVAQEKMQVWQDQQVTEFEVNSIDSITFGDQYSNPLIGSYAYGADCSWITEQEADGVLFYDSLGQAADGMRVMRDAGMNSVRLRVWVNHTTGWCNKEDVIIKAKRAAALKLRVMIDFHYSDFFADPSRQDIPVDWVDYDLAQMHPTVIVACSGHRRKKTAQAIVATVGILSPRTDNAIDPHLTEMTGCDMFQTVIFDHSQPQKLQIKIIIGQRIATGIFYIPCQIIDFCFSFKRGAESTSDIFAYPASQNLVFQNIFCGKFISLCIHVHFSLFKIVRQI